MAITIKGTEFSKVASTERFALFNIRRDHKARGRARIDFGKDPVNPELVRILVVDQGKRPLAGFTFHADIDAALEFAASLIR